MSAFKNQIDRCVFESAQQNLLNNPRLQAPKHTDRPFLDQNHERGTGDIDFGRLRNGIKPLRRQPLRYQPHRDPRTQHAIDPPPQGSVGQPQSDSRAQAFCQAGLLLCDEQDEGDRGPVRLGRIRSRRRCRQWGEGASGTCGFSCRRSRSFPTRNLATAWTAHRTTARKLNPPANVPKSR